MLIGSMLSVVCSTPLCEIYCHWFSDFSIGLSWL